MKTFDITLYHKVRKKPLLSFRIDAADKEQARKQIATYLAFIVKETRYSYYFKK